MARFSAEEKPVFHTIEPEEAYHLMQSEQEYTILDVRTPEEYREGHVPGAIVLPYDEITQEKASAILPDKAQLILVYCRSGRRSKIGAQTLIDLGYTNVQEFGGIIDWPYEIE